MQRRFVGRSTELQVIQEAMHRAASGHGGVVVLAGQAGIGKTTLINEAVARFAGEPWRLGRGFCLHEAGAPPLWPWQRSLRLTQVSVPETGPEPATPAELASAQFQRLSLAAEHLTAATAVQPLLVVLEDLHWADSASLGLLSHVAQQAPESHLLVLATVREPSPDNVTSVLAGLARYGAQTMRLQPFTTVEIGQLVGPADLNRVAGQTGGLPLLVAVTATGAGADVRSAVEGLLRPIPADQQNVLMTAALMSDDIDETQLAAVTGAAAEEIGEALESGRRAGLVTTGESGYRFTHNLLRDALAAKVSLQAAAQIHQQVAVHLADTAPAATVAAHWRKAGQSPQALRQTVHWSKAAARQAIEGYAADDAIGHLTTAYQTLLKLDRRSPDLPGLLVELAAAEYLCSRFTISLEHCTQAAGLARELKHPELIAKAALVLRNVSYPEAAQIVSALSQEALSYPDLDPVLRARLLAQVAAIDADNGEAETAKHKATAALQLAARTADPLAELDAVRASEMCLNHPDDVLERLTLSERATELAHALGDPVAAVIAQTWRAKAGYQLARLDIVDGAISAIGAIAKIHGLHLARWHHLRACAGRAALEGKFGQARSLNAEATELASRTGDTVAVGMSYVFGQHLGELRGDPGELLPGTIEAMSQAPPLPLITSARACLYVLLGDRDHAARYYEELLPLLRHPVVDVRWGGVVVQAAQLAVVFGDAETGALVADLLRPLSAYPGAMGITTSYVIGSASQLMGRLAMLTGDHTGAEQWLRTAIQHNIALQARPHVVLSKLDLAETLLAQGRPAQATSVIQEAQAEAKRLDMPGALAHAARLREASAGPDPLTPREREVAELIMQARTNRQIASQFVLSERTVESHVRSILTKLGCANRAELIARGATTRRD